MSTDINDRDIAACECCNLPFCERKSPGVGYYCEVCLGHAWADQNPYQSRAEGDAEIAQVIADHETLLHLWAGVSGYFERNVVPVSAVVEP